MSSVWFIGPGVSVRRLSISDWARIGLVASSDSEWNYNNGWSISESSFTAGQLAWLHNQDEFVTAQADGPRTAPSPSPTPFTNDPSGFAYYLSSHKLELLSAAVTFIQQQDPEITDATYSGPAIWYQTDGSGQVIGNKVRF